MKKYIQQYRPFLMFLGSFFLSYILLTFVYQKYLEFFDAKTPDGITTMVSHQTAWFLQFFGSESTIYPVLKEWYLSYNGNVIVRIVEGCNGISVFILFISFIIAFSSEFKRTVLFIVLGTLLIYVLNVLRIAALTVLLYRFPQYSHLLHGVLFPLVIYGVVFILWFIWVSKFSKYAN